MQNWLSIVEEIADFLFQINPYWEKSAVESLIRNQLQLQYDLALQLKKENFQQGIANFDLGYDNARKAAQLTIYGIEDVFGSELWCT